MSPFPLHRQRDRFKASGPARHTNEIPAACEEECTAEDYLVESEGYRLLLGEDLIDGEILRGVGEEGLIGAADEDAGQLVDVDLPRHEDVLPGGDAVLLVVVDPGVSVEGKSI